MNTNCGQCAWRGINRGICPFFQEKREAEDKICPKFKVELEICEICGRPISMGGILTQDSSGTWHIICNDCYARYMKTCTSCRNGQRCLFEEHPSPNKIIMETFRQGNMQIQKQVRNKEIERDTCLKSCPCFSQENGCLREINYCNNYKLPWEE